MGGAPDEDPLPADNEDPHPVPVFGPQIPLLPLLLGVKLVVGVSGWLLCRILLLVGIIMKVGTLGKLLLFQSKVL